MEGIKMQKLPLLLLMFVTRIEVVRHMDFTRGFIGTLGMFQLVGSLISRVKDQEVQE
jgi:hypothetical protein